MTEEWRPVADCEGYEVSDLGRVRSFKRGEPFVRSLCGTRYRHVIMRVGGKPVIRYVHKMVAEAFIGPRPPGCDINHRDCDRLNNLPSNLEYVTHQENMAHAVRMGRGVGKRGQGVAEHLWGARDRCIRDMRALGLTFLKIGTAMDLTPERVRQICAE